MRHQGYLTFRNRGFTLIELMVSVAIVGVLLAILFPAIAFATEKARITAMFHTGYEVRRTLMIYYNHHGYFPKDRDEAIQVLNDNRAPHNLPYPWKHTTILDPEIYTHSAYYPYPDSVAPQDYVWCWPLPDTSITKMAIKMFFPVVVEIPYSVDCETDTGASYNIAITSTQVLIVGGTNP